MSFPSDLPVLTSLAREDITISEVLETMRGAKDDKPGEHCFIGDDGHRCWIRDAELEKFITRYGALHPSSYLITHGIHWKINFFKHTL